MRHTPFAGLTVIEAGDSINADNQGFLQRNPDVIDALLRLGAVAHRHDAHPPMAGPAGAPTVTTQATGGSLPAGLTLNFAYTLLDVDGGETLPSPLATITTPGPLPPPLAAPTAALETTAGTLRADVYRYAITATDGQGGETSVGPFVELIRPVGPANAQIRLGGLQTAATAVGGSGWRLYRSTSGSQWMQLATGTDEGFLDDGTPCVDCDQQPPDTFDNTTNQQNSITVHVPAMPAGVTGYRLYAGNGPTFGSPSLVGQYVDAGDVDIPFGALVFLAGQPPVTATSVGGAHQIDANTDIANLNWKGPVATAGDLPTDAAEGDVRIALDDGTLHAFRAGAWTAVGGGDGGGELLNAVGDPMPAGPLQFVQGDNVILDVANNAGVNQVTITAAAGGGGGSTIVRANAIGDTGVLDPDAGETVIVAMGATTVFNWLNPDRPARIRIYTDTASRDADIARDQSTPMPVNAGVILDVVTDANGVAFSPAITGILANPTDAGYPVYVENLDTVAAVVALNINYIAVEPRPGG